MVGLCGVGNGLLVVALGVALIAGCLPQGGARGFDGLALQAEPDVKW